MFEIKGTDIANLSDGDLRTLVARLALSELRAQGYPLSSVSAGGNQDAADGGLDVRVECPVEIAKPDFVPRAVTGFQVKKPNMPPSAIRQEMRPGGVLRPVIGELAAASGAYIIVSAQGSVTDKPLAERRAAIRAQLHDLADAEKLYTDFYDRDRVATWVNEYPGIAAWVRSQLGLQLAGWSSIGNWAGTTVAELKPYLHDDKSCITNEMSNEHHQLTLGEGIARLRTELKTPKKCIRLIGLSGLGKTRLVQALFESSVGETPLDPSLAVYTDYSEETDPTARDMARQLVMRGQRAILVVDNCKPETHTELANICSEEVSKVSLLTVEYDVRADEPEHTEVYRLRSASPELVSGWLEQSFPNVSQVDRRTISGFSDGNFRVARAIAETLAKGETLGKLKSLNLFERIFQQRHEHDRDLLLAAQEISLLYSVDGTDCSLGSELELIGRIRGVGANVLYAALVSLRQRGIAQSRGRWRAILPHAIANQLANFSLERIPPSDFDRFCSSLTQRMQKSLTRRLGYLHDNAEAQATVARLMSAEGPFGDLFSQGEFGIQLITNVAPVAPETVLKKIQQKLDSPNGKALLSISEPTRGQWIRLIKTLSYDSKMFELAAMLLIRFIAVEPDNHNHNAARRTFAELFHLHLSGTLATPEQRVAIINHLANSDDIHHRRCASIALGALLKTGHFTSTNSFDFGARSRDWGWRPKLNRDVWDWYIAAIKFTIEISPILSDAREILASKVRELWRIPACQDVLEQAAANFTKHTPWIEGWLGFRMSLRYDSKAMPEVTKARLKSLIQKLSPSDLLHRARAVVLNGTNGNWDIIDCEIDENDENDVINASRKVSEMAQEIGRMLANAPETRREFLAELLAQPSPRRSFECGRGLAEESDDLSAMWLELSVQYAATEPSMRNIALLGGFIYEAHQRDKAFALSVLEAAIDDCELRSNLPYLQARIGIDKDGIHRLQRAIRKGAMKARDFYSIANGVVCDSPPEYLGALLLDIASLEGGVKLALDILQMHFYDDKNGVPSHNQSLIKIGRKLLCRADFSERDTVGDFGMRTLIKICCQGIDGEATTRIVSKNIYTALESVQVSSYDASYALKALFDTQPFIALDVFLLHEAAPGKLRPFMTDYDLETPIENMDSVILRQWADIDATIRYPVISNAISMFKYNQGNESNELSPLFLEMLAFAPDKYSFIGNYWTRMQPHGWSGSLADILIQRKTQLTTLDNTCHPDVQRWLVENTPAIDLWIDNERKNDREQEESFE